MPRPCSRGSRCARWRQPIEVSKLEMTLAVADQGEEIGLRLAYQTDLFHRATAVRVLDQVTRLVDAVVARPGAALADLDVLDSASRARLLGPWSQATADQRPAAHTLLVHRMIALQAQATPEAVAVSWQEDALSYRELVTRSRRLAHHLRDLGIGPESRVGVALERSFDLVVSLLAVLEAGAG